MAKRYFGTDGIRGQVGVEPITPETVLKLGWAAGTVLSRLNHKAKSKILIGKDTRVSGYLLESALECGLSAAGVNIRLLGPMPTPAIAYLTRTARACAGIVISASHNPYQDNGIKFFSSDGAKLPDDVELAIEEAMQQPMQTVASDAFGKVKGYPDAGGRYVEYCKSTFPFGQDLSHLKIVIDCANGAAYQVAPHVFGELGADVVIIANEPDGFNINKECGSTHPKRLQRVVREEQADLGIALDGDGDRLIMVDADGAVLDGDQLLYIIGSAKQQQGQLKGGIVGTLMSNLGLELACKQRGIPFKRAKVGDRYVLAMLHEEGWELGGETSGHVLCLDKSTTGDGIVTALQVLAAMLASDKTLAQLKQGLEIYPQSMINVRIAAQGNGQSDIQSSQQVQQAVAAVESELADYGRVVLRASGTEPVIRVMVEGQDWEQVQRLSQQLADTVKAASEAT